jgi:hypothetical protein
MPFQTIAEENKNSLKGNKNPKKKNTIIFVYNSQTP